MASKSKQIRRSKYELTFQLKAIEYAEKNNNHAAARLFGVSECNIRRWRKKQNKLKEMPNSKLENNNQSRQKTHYGLFEKYLDDWLENQKAITTITPMHVKQQAINMAKTDKTKMPTFTLTTEWCVDFLKRHLSGRNQTLRRQVSKKNSSHSEHQEMDCQRFNIELSKENGFTLDQNRNVHEKNPEFFKLVNNKVIDKHFVGGNGPTRDHPDPLPVRPMNMLPSMVGYAEAGPSNQTYSGKPENSRRKKIATATISSETVLIPDDSPPQPTAPKLQKKQIDDRRFDERRFDDQRFVERRFENRRFEERRQMAAAQSAQMASSSLQHPSQMQVQQHLQVTGPPPLQAQPPQRQVQVLAPPVQVPVPKPKPVEKPRPREKRIFVVADHQRCVMSNLSSLWKSGKLCDAGIGNGSSTVMVHKVVLSAVCPKLLSVFSTDILSHKFLQVNFPEEVSTEALNAFAEYMYNGILDLDRDILEQLKIIAKRLDMKEFEQLCDSHLPNHMHQRSAAASSFTHIPLIQTSMQIPDMTSSLVSPITTSMLQSAPSITTQVIDVKQEITDAELAQVQKDTAAVFGQESAVLSLAPNKSGDSAGFVICPSIKAEPVGPDDNRYGCLTSNTNQVFTSTTSSSSSQPTATSSFTSISSVPTSSTEYSIPFSQSTDVKSTRLKSSHSYETPLVSDLSPVSRIVQTVCSQSSAIKEDTSQSLTQQSIPTSSVELSLTSADDSSIYPVGLFTAAGANLPLLTTETVDVKTIDLYKTDLT